jgi:histidinol-phosphatase (PHP family)
MPLERATNYTREIAQIKQEYAKKLQIYTGMEVDYVPGTIGPNNRFIKNLGLDYTIGSVHFVDRFPDDTPWEIEHAKYTTIRNIGYPSKKRHITNGA